MILNQANYYSKEADMEYMSASQFKNFKRCEAAAMAELRDEYAQNESTALLVGGYVDAHFEGTLDVYRAQHPEIFKKDGTLKSDFVKADEIIARAERDELFMLLMSGKKQVIVTGKIAGVPFKGKIDSLLDADACREMVRRFPETAPVVGFGDGMIVDLKCMKDMHRVWSDDEHSYVSFVDAWGYDYQGAIYQKLEGHALPFVLAVTTKETEPNLEAISLSGDDLDLALSDVDELAPRYAAIKRGEIEPERCEKCPYCIATKKLHRIIDLTELEV